MGKGSEQTFLQRRHTDGQEAHEKMLNIINHQGNETQNHNEISPPTCQNGYQQNTTSTGKDEEKREHSCTVGGNVNWCSHYGKQFGGSSQN